MKQSQLRQLIKECIKEINIETPSNPLIRPYVEFVGEKDTITNDLAELFISSIEDELNSGVKSGVVTKDDFGVEDWFSNLLYYILTGNRKGKATITASVQKGKMWTPPVRIVFDRDTQEINWEVIPINI